MRQFRIKTLVNYRLMTAFLLIGVLLVTAIPIYNAKRAAMFDGGYPYASAARCYNKDTNKYEGCVADPWGFYERECTSFVAWKLNLFNGVNFYNTMKGGRFGNASNWGNNAKSIGYVVNNTPATGSVAWWSSGHVAWVSQVDATGVYIEEYNNDYNGNYNARKIPSTPTGYIHIADLGTTAEIIGQILVVQAGSNLYGKSSPTDTWTTLANSYSRNLQVVGSRIAYVNSGGTLMVKEGLSGAWIQEFNGPDEYAITPNLLLVRVGSTLYGKEKLTDGWTTLTNSVTPGFTASGSRVAFRMGNALMTKDGLYGTWKTQMTGLDDYAISSSLIVARIGSTLYGKVNPDDSWTTLATGVTSDYKVVGNRIAFKAGNTLRVKDGLTGVWVDQFTGLDDYAISENMIVVRVGSTLYGKVAQYDTWTKLTTDAPTNVRLVGQWVTFKSDNALVAKQGINGQWFTQFTQLDDYVVGR